MNSSESDAAAAAAASGDQGGAGGTAGASRDGAQVTTDRALSAQGARVAATVDQTGRDDAPGSPGRLAFEARVLAAGGSVESLGAVQPPAPPVTPPPAAQMNEQTKAAYRAELEDLRTRSRQGDLSDVDRTRIALLTQHEADFRAPAQTGDPSDARSAVERLVDDEIRNAVEFAHSALDIAVGDSKAVLPQVGGDIVGLVLSHVPSVGPFRSEVQNFLGRAFGKKPDQTLGDVPPAVSTGLAHALRGLEAKS